MSQKIGLIDYGLGNLFSVERALKAVKADYLITDDPAGINQADRLILPGVGAFADGMKGLKERNLIKPIRAAVDKGKPVLGICLGMQLLMDVGYEFGKHRGLGLIPGKVNKIKSKEKLPQIGWNSIKKPNKVTWKNTILDSIKDADYFYFVHSYVVRPTDEENVLATTNYGGDEFCSLVGYNKVYGVQFHPEKSNQAGLMIYANFLKKV